MGTTLLLILMPIVILSAGVFIYKFQGKKDLLHLDLVQFIYTFILAPLLFIWFKTFFFLLLKTNGSLSEQWLFILDTAFTMLLFYLYAFIVMHSLTKTFRLKSIDPLYDFFYHNEYIHLWLSHLVMLFGSISLLVILGLLNLFLPQGIYFSRQVLIGLLLIGFVSGVVGYLTVMMADPKQQKKRVSFTRIAKLAMGAGFLILMTGFFIITPSFNSGYFLYWFVLTFFAGMTTMGAFSYKSPRFKARIDSWVDHLVHFDWGNNLDLFFKKSKQKEKG